MMTSDPSNSNPEDSADQVHRLVAAAMKLPPSERPDFVLKECGSDIDLQAEVMACLGTFVMEDTAEGIEPPQDSADAGIHPSSDDATFDDHGETNIGETFEPDSTLDLATPETSSMGGYGGTMDLPVAGAGQNPIKPASPLASEKATLGNMPERVAEFKIIKLLGSGGMGSVYLAQQDSPNRQIAVKVMKLGLATETALKRFEFEIETLARLAHPGIASLYEAGIHVDDDGERVPYVAMEFVAGARPITNFCSDLDLDLRAKLSLFRKTCDAVAYGHARGVIHRDLKPDNILVDDDGNPKVIDFGVARATEGDDSTGRKGQIVGTLQYMSPEQVIGSEDVHTSTDVYALGLILYEILAEKVPYTVRGRLSDVRDTIATVEPAWLSSVDQSLAGDVETIVAKSLDKDSDRRYRSASELGDDIQRYLDDEPINARPPGTGETIRRLARKHKPVVAMLLFSVLVVIGALVAVTNYAIQADRAREVAVKEERRAREAEAKALTEKARTAQLAELQTNMILKLNSKEIGETIRGAIRDNIEESLAIQGLEQGQRAQVLESSMGQLDRTDLTMVGGKVISKHVIDPLQRDLQYMDNDQSAEVLFGLLLSKVNINLGRYEPAREQLIAVLEISDQINGLTSPPSVDARMQLANILVNQDRTEEAGETIRKAIEQKQVAGENRDLSYAELVAQLGMVNAARGRIKEAEANWSESLLVFNESVEQLATADQPRIMEKIRTIRSNLAIMLMKNQEFDEASVYMQEAYEYARTNYGDSSEQFGDAALSLAELTVRMGDVPRAIELATEARNAFVASIGRGFSQTGQASLLRGNYLAMNGQFKEAAPVLREAWLTLRKTVGANEQVTFDALSLLNISLFNLAVADNSRIDESLQVMKEFRRVSEQVLGVESPAYQENLFRIFAFSLNNGDPRSALDAALALNEICESLPGEGRIPQCAQMKEYLLKCYRNLAEIEPDGGWSEKIKELEAGS